MSRTAGTAGLGYRPCDCCARQAAKRWSIEIAGSVVMVCQACKDAVEGFIERLGK